MVLAYFCRFLDMLSTVANNCARKLKFGDFYRIEYFISNIRGNKNACMNASKSNDIKLY